MAHYLDLVPFDKRYRIAQRGRPSPARGRLPFWRGFFVVLVNTGGMNNGRNSNKSHEAVEDTIERAVARDTDPLTLLETEDALSSIANAELIRSAGDALNGKRLAGDK